MNLSPYSKKNHELAEKKTAQDVNNFQPKLVNVNEVTLAIICDFNRRQKNCKIFRAANSAINGTAQPSLKAM